MHIESIVLSECQCVCAFYLLATKVRLLFVFSEKKRSYLNITINIQANTQLIHQTVTAPKMTKVW